MKLRTGDPWMSGVEYSSTLRGLTINLLVREIEGAVQFAREVLGAEVVYSDPDFAALRYDGQEWMLHADHTYEGHDHLVRTQLEVTRGTGVELRIHGRSPDDAALAAEALGCEVMTPPEQKPHGMRETFIIDHDGYTWVVDEFVGPLPG